MTKIIIIGLIGLFLVTAARADIVSAPDIPKVSHTDAPVVVYPALFSKIGWCESHNRADARNPSSTAKGRYQFLDGSWKYYGTKYWGDALKYRDVLNYSDSTELAFYVYQTVGTSPWDASKSCWQPTKDV